VALGPVGHVAETSDPLLGVELDVAEPRVAICKILLMGNSSLPCISERFTFRAAAPLSLGDVDIGVHDDVLGGCCLGDIVPDLEAGRILCPARVLFDDLLRNARAIGVSQGVDHGDFERNILALTVVDLVNHLDRIGPGMMLA
jgi:hypothetical protein